MRKFLHAVLNIILILFTAKDDECVRCGACDYSGQGRDKYGN